jgi:hypothetical protein
VQTNHSVRLALIVSGLVDVVELEPHAKLRLYYTQFIGDPISRPIIKGCSNFEGIGLIDTDVYIPGG